MTGAAGGGPEGSAVMRHGRALRQAEWLDRFAGSDPGLNRLRLASQAVVSIGAAMAAEWLFVRQTGALQVPLPASPSQALLVAALNHALLVVAMLLGAITGMLSSFGGSMFAAPRGQLAVFALMPVEMLAGLTLGLSLGPDRVAGLAALCAVLSAGTYCRRFGPLGFLGGMVAFLGDFLGFFLNGEVSLAGLGWLAAEIGIGVLVAAVAQYTLFFPSRRAALRRMLRSYSARARDIARRSSRLFDSGGGDEQDRARRALARRLVRLNEAGLLIDAALADPAAVPPLSSALVLHQAVFDAELALTNMARFAGRLAGLPLPVTARSLIREALAAIAMADLAGADTAARALLGELGQLRGPAAPDPAAAAGRTADGSDAEAGLAPADLIVAHRFAVSVTGLVAAAHGWRRATDAHPARKVLPVTGSPAADAAQLEALATDLAREGLADAQPGARDRDEAGEFEASTWLVGGWLPGSVPVSAAASEASERGRGWNRVRLAPYTRTAIQMGVAVSGAVVLGDLVSGRRFYWALIGAFVTFMGTANTGEQLRKSAHRVAGTAAGVLLGAVFAHLVGDRTGLAIAVILAAMFAGLYLMRVSYGFMVVGITIMVSQLYVQLGEYSNSLLVLRLEETALGAAVAAATVLLVVPLRTRRVARVATADYVRAAASVSAAATGRLLDPAGPDGAVRKAARDTDAAYQALLAVLAPPQLPFPWASDRQQAQLLHAAGAARHYARNLVVDTSVPVPLTDDQRQQIEAAAGQLAASLEQLAAEPAGRESTARYVRSASLFDLVTAGDPALAGAPVAGGLSPLILSMRDLQLLDGAMAALSQAVGMPVAALDAPLAGAGRI